MPQIRRETPRDGAASGSHPPPTDRGLYIASGQGYGATHALSEARDTIERQIRDRNTRGRNKKPRSEEFWEKRFGWLLEGGD